MAVRISFNLPENVVKKLQKQGEDLARLSLEKVVCSLYHEGELTHFEAMQAIGSPSRLALDQLLARLHLQRSDYSWDDFAEDGRVFDKSRGK